MRRKERHELKQNELLMLLDSLAIWASSNGRTLRTGSLLAVLGAVVVGGVHVYQRGRQQEAETLLAEGMAVYHGVVRENTVISGPDDGPTFESAEARYGSAVEAFQKVESQFGSLPQGREARYYLALSKAGLGEVEQAQALLEDVIRKRGDLLYYLASQTLATVKAERGDHAGAAELYRALLDDPQVPLPKDQLLFSMAQQLEEDGKLEEARQAYLRFLEEYPQSSLRSQAEQRSELLEYRLSASPA